MRCESLCVHGLEAMRRVPSAKRAVCVFTLNIRVRFAATLDCGEHCDCNGSHWCEGWHESVGAPMILARSRMTHTYVAFIRICSCSTRRHR